MTLFYSATTRGFYDSEVHSEDFIPVDKVEISAEYHQELLNNQSDGFTIVPDENGYPISKIVEPDPNTAEQNAVLAKLFLENTNWAVMPDVADPNMANPYLVNQNDFISYRNALRQILINPTDGNIEWPTQPKEQWSNT